MTVGDVLNVHAGLNEAIVLRFPKELASAISDKVVELAGQVQAWDLMRKGVAASSRTDDEKDEALQEAAGVESKYIVEPFISRTVLDRAIGDREVSALLYYRLRFALIEDRPSKEKEEGK